MKKFFYSILAAATMLFATTSCSQEEEIVNGGSESGKTQKVTFKIEMPGEATSRAIEDGVEVGQANKANKLAWALYEVNKESGDPLDTGVAEKQAASKEFSVSIDMVKGLQYKVLFLAYNEDGTIFDVTTGDDLKSLNYKSSVVSNKEAYDAFVACHTHTVNDEAVTSVTLKRPFAQINAATTQNDLTKAAKLGATVTASELVIEQVPTQYNVLTGEVSEYQDVTYTKDAILYQTGTTTNEIIEVGNETYHYLNMVYVLAGEGTSTSSTHDAKFTFYRDAEPQLVRTIDIVNLPIQRNYRTNVIGDLITQTEAFKIIIDAEFDTPSFDENGSEVAAKTETVATVAELQNAINAANGPTIIKFEQDIDANSSRSATAITILQKVGTDLVIDGCGYKFDGTFYLEGGMQGGSSPETLTFKNINFNHTSTDALDFISADDAKTLGKRYAHNVTVENCTFTGNGKENVVGMRYRQCFNMTVKNCTFTGMHSMMWATGTAGISIDNVTIENCKSGVSFGTSTNIVLENSNITADVYGIRADGSVSTNLKIKNTTITAEQPVIIRKVLTDGYSVALEGTNNFTASGDYQVVFTSGEDDAEYVEPTVDYSITGAENMTIFPVRTLHEESGLIWNGSKFFIYSAEDLVKAANYFAGQTHTNEGKIVTIDLESDIDLAGTEWTPWSVMWIILNGNNHTISNVNVAEGWRVGFFGYIGASKVNDLILTNVNVTGAQAGILAGSIEGVTTNNIKIDGNNSVTYKEYASAEYTETWGGIGAVTGILVNSTINAEIVEGAKVTINYNDIDTEASYKNYKTGYLESNKGSVIENGQIILNGTIKYGAVGYSVSEDGTNATFSAVGENAKTVRGVLNDSKIKNVVVGEGIETIGDRTFRDMPLLETVTLPNTVKTFEEGAFQGCGINSLIVPESVTYMGKQSIGYLPNLETIIINAKNVTIGNYIARACPKLTSVYIYSEDIAFESGSMYFTNKENADASAITFYVSSNAVADKLYAASSSSHSYGMKIVSLDGSQTYYNTLK